MILLAAEFPGWLDRSDAGFRDTDHAIQATKEGVGPAELAVIKRHMPERVFSSKLTNFTPRR